MKGYVVIIFTSYIIALISGQQDQQFEGPCPEVTTLRNLDKAQYLGLWYEIKRFSNTLVPGDCGSADYYEQTPHGYNITYTSIDVPGKETKIRILIEKEVLKSQFAKYDVYYDCEKNQISHYILGTDYTSYSVVWGCSENAGRNTQRLFIYSREKTLDKESLDKAIEILNAFNIDDSLLKDVAQDEETCSINEPNPEEDANRNNINLGNLK